MKNLILILAIVLLGGSLFAQGTIRIGLPILPRVHTSDAEIVLTEADCGNVIHINGDADAIEFTLPGAKLGLVAAFWDISGAVVTVNPADGVDKIWVEAQDGGAGNSLESDGVIGRYIVLVAVDNTSWWALPIETLTWGIP